MLENREPTEAPSRVLTAALAEAMARKGELRAASEQLRGQVEAEQRAVQHAQRAVEAAAAAVLGSSPEVERAIARLEEAQTELIAAADAVAFLIRQNVVPVLRAAPGGADANEGLAARAASALRRLESAPLSWASLIAEKPGVRHWEAVLAALQVDSQAEIPA